MFCPRYVALRSRLGSHRFVCTSTFEAKTERSVSARSPQSRDKFDEERASSGSSLLSNALSFLFIGRTLSRFAGVKCAECIFSDSLFEE